MMSESSAVCATIICAAVSVLLLQPASAIPIDNGVEGTEVECTATSITVSFGTKNPFSGRIYVKGMADKDECVNGFSDGAAVTDTKPTVTFPFGACNMQRARTLSPQRGMMQSLVVIISFHRIFLTKVDRAYRVQCFYMEAEKIVSADLSVSMLTTDDIRDTGRMPTCTYTVRSDSRDGPPIRYARIGDQVYHEWECDSTSHSILIKDCYVNDGQGSRQEVIDSKGCAIDPVIMPDLTYDADTAKAWVESHVFKYADKPNVLFQCVVQICNRGEPSCVAITPPQCTTPSAAAARLALLRRRRSAAEELLERRPVDRRSVLGTSDDDDETTAEMDLQSNGFIVLDLEDTTGGGRRRASSPVARTIGFDDALHDLNSDGTVVDSINEPVCMSSTSFSVLLGAVAVMFLVSVTVAAVLYCHRAATIERKLIERNLR